MTTSKAGTVRLALTQAKAALAGEGSCEQALRQLVAVAEERLEDERLNTSSERRRIERVGLLSNIIATIPHYVFWKDKDCVYQGCNQAFAAVAGVDRPEDIIGKTDYDLAWEKAEADFFVETDKKVMRAGVSQLNIVEPQRQADGRHRYLETSKVPLRDESGNVRGMLGIFSDITVRKRMEEDLLAAKEAAEASNQAKSDFLAAASHELRTPLTLMLGPLQSLLQNQEWNLDAATRETLHRVYRNASRLKILTDDILDFSRAQADLMSLSKEPVQLCRHLAQLVGDLSPAASAKGIDFTTSCEEIADSVLIDVGKLDKIVMNLIGNALKFTPSGGSIYFGIKRVNRKFEILVKDSGIGIAKEHHESIFQRFEQVEGGSTRQFGGTGLGLALVKQFSELMGGTVTVESELGKGATFRVILPCEDAQVEEGEVLEREPGATVMVAALVAGVDSQQESALDVREVAGESGSQPTLLVAEDNKALRDYIASLFRSDYRVIAVANGRQAYDVAVQERPDVILSDVMMPEMDGSELLKKVKNTEGLQTTPVLLLTARGGSKASATGLHQGAEDYITKPFTPLDLTARVRAAVRTHKMHRALREAESRTAETERLASLGRLLANLSHEINNPMNVIYNSSDVVIDYAKTLTGLVNQCETLVAPENQEQFAEARKQADWDFVCEDLPLAVSQIRESAWRVRDIQSNFRHFLRGDDSPVCESCDVNELVQQALEDTRRSYTKDLNLLSELQPSLPPLFLDSVRIGQLIRNLLNNAADAVAEDGTIVVRTRLEAEELVLEVLDDGSGIEAESLRQVFEPFFTTKTVGQGTGLGLAICREVVAQHQGRIFAGHRDPNGTMFTVALPLAGLNRVGEADSVS